MKKLTQILLNKNMKNFKYLLFTFLLTLFFGVVLNFLFVSNVQAEEIKIVRACSTGMFVRYTDCDTGKAVYRSALAPGKHRFSSISTDGKSFKVLISGGTGIYQVIVTLSNNQNFYVADYPAMSSAVTLTAESKRLGWTSSGVEIFAPKDISKSVIQYPIVELGNCKNQADCKLYCSKQENMIACATYGEKYGLISKEDLAKTKEFADVLKGEGPGGCKDEATCKNYCSGISHINECLSFAEKHNLLSADQLSEAKKVAEALQSGAKLPGDCKDKNTCENYCKNSANIDECFSFAKAAGFMTKEQIAEAEKVIPLMKNGQTPGQCKTKAECQTYCESKGNFSECVGFAEKAGFISKEEADLAKKVGGEGPGGCKSKETCDAYCNVKENQKECFNFASKYNLIPAEKLKEMQDGMGRLRSGLDQMPVEAIACLKDKLGDGVIGEIQSGNFMPGQDTGDIIKGCFDKVLPQLQAKLQQGLQQATPETLTCLKSGLGEDTFNKIQSGEAPNPENGDVLKKCFESMKVEGMKKLRSGLDKMPAEMKNCVKEKIGADKFVKIENGESVEIGPEVESIIQGCVADLKSVIQSKLNQAMGQAPPEVKSCIQLKINAIEDKIKSGEIKESDIPGLIQECVSSMGPGDVPSAPGSSDSQGPDCSSFTSVPSCSYVPESVRSTCSKCKGE